MSRGRRQSGQIYDGHKGYFFIGGHDKDATTETEAKWVILMTVSDPVQVESTGFISVSETEINKDIDSDVDTAETGCGQKH